MKIKLMINSAEIAEVQRLSRADFQSPTQWVSKMLVLHLQDLRKRATEASEQSENVGGIRPGMPIPGTDWVVGSAGVFNPDAPATTPVAYTPQGWPNVK